MKKRIAAMVLAGAMALSLAPAYGVTEVKAEAGDMKIAMVTDSGDITDQSFNQTTYEACKAWSEENGSEFNYYKPESDSDEARNASVDQAVADGANVIVLPGYMFAATIVEQSEMYPDVKFIAPDVSAGDICEKGVGEGYTYNPDDYEVTDYYNADNVYCCTYQEEISGYMAGYAAVKLGYKHLGFLGGIHVSCDVCITVELSSAYILKLNVTCDSKLFGCFVYALNISISKTGNSRYRHTAEESKMLVSKLHSLHGYLVRKQGCRSCIRMRRWNLHICSRSSSEG